MKKIILSLIILSLGNHLSKAQSLVKNINLGPASSFPYILGTLPNGKTILYANDDIHGNEIWATNGTSAGTSLVLDINEKPGTGSIIGYGSIVYNGKLYFCANDGVHGNELWMTDGTEAGTSIVKDINPGSGEGFGNSQLFVFKGKLYFTALDGVNGIELWRTDGTTTELFKDINTTEVTNSRPSYFYEAFDKLFFSASDGITGNEWWTSDGTPEGTKLLADLNTGPLSGALSPLILYKSWLYFSGSANSALGIELYRTNGETIELVKDIYTGTANSGSPTDLIVAGSNLYFWANDGVNGFELWKTDGTPGNTVLVKNITSGSGSTSGFMVGELNGKLLFVAYEPVAGNELWVSDGSATNVMKDINPGKGNGIFTINSETFSKSSYAYINSNYIYNGNYYFAGNDGTNGTELWKTNGTADGTKMLNQINPGAGSSALSWIFIGGGKAWMSATDGSTGTELFSYTIGTGNISQINLNKHLEVYPNPASVEIILKETGAASISDMYGKVISDFQNNGEAINISELPAGIYSIRVVNSEGIYNFRFMKN